MKKSRFVLSILALALVIAICLTTVIALSSPMSNATNDVTPISGEVSKSIMSEISKTGVSVGTPKLVAEKKDNWGNPQLIFQDDKYEYYVDADKSEIVTMVLKDEHVDSLVKLSTEAPLSIDYSTLAYSYVDSILGSYNKDAMTIKSYVNKENPVEYASCEIKEQVGDCLVNTGYMSFAIDGTLVLYGGTHNTLDDFKDSNKLTQAMVEDIVFDALMKAKADTKYSDIISDISVSPKIDPPLQAGDINPQDEQIGKVPVETPEFEIYVDSKEDLHFKKVYKSIQNNSVIWNVQAQVNTSWGKIDRLFNYIICFKIDANSGEILETEAISGE